MPKGPLLCLANPASGRGRALAAAETLCATLSGAGWGILLEKSREPGWMARRVAGAAGEFRAVVAVGGDGTVNEVAQGLRGSGIPLAAFPTGTVNLLARVYGLPAEPVRFLRMLEGWRTVPLDLGLAGDRVFLSCAGAGFDAEVVRRLHERRRGGIRIWNYLPHLAGALAAGATPRIRARLDGQDYGTFAQVIVGNLPLYAGFLRFTPEARGDDGKLDVALFPGGRRRDLMRYAFSAARGRRSRDVLVRRASEIRLEGEGPALLQLDGDMGGSLPATLGVQPGALSLLVP